MGGPQKGFKLGAIKGCSFNNVREARAVIYPLILSLSLYIRSIIPLRSRTLGSPLLISSRTWEYNRASHTRM